MNIIYVVIVTYNGMQWIEKCIDSLIHSNISLNIIIIDNLSTDGTVEFIKKNYPTVEIVETGKNLGFGKANNIGITQAAKQNADYVFLLNQDAWVGVDTIDELVKIHKQNPEYGILSPIHLNGKGDTLDYKFSLQCNATDCPGYVSDLVTSSLKQVYTINFANAALWLISKECIKKAGAFDPIFPHYGEDFDYVNRIKYHGFKLGIASALMGFHDREERPYSEKRERIITQLWYLCVLKDIRKSLFTGFVIVCAYWARFTMQKVAKFKFRSVIHDIGFAFKLMFSIGAIIKSRRRCKLQGAYL